MASFFERRSLEASSLAVHLFSAHLLWAQVSARPVQPPPLRARAAGFLRHSPRPPPRPLAPNRSLRSPQPPRRSPPALHDPLIVPNAPARDRGQSREVPPFARPIRRQIRPYLARSPRAKRAARPAHATLR